MGTFGSKGGNKHEGDKMSEEVKEEVVVETPENASTGSEETVTMADVYHDTNAPIMTVRKLLEAGVQFGHQTRRWNPKMQDLIYGARNNIHIIDLVKSAAATEEAYHKLYEIAKAGGKVLFVGTKPSSKQAVIDEATRSGSFYITNRWLGGTLTNFRTILTRIKKLKDLEQMEEDGSMERLSKKEQAANRKLLEKLSKNLGGIKEMRRTPQALIVTDPTVEHNAVKEANTLGIPVFALCDTNDDPTVCTYPIGANNDGSASVRLLVAVLADAIAEAKGGATEIAYTKDASEEATMKDAIRAADIANEQRKALIRQQRKEREERMARLQQERAARWAAKKAERDAAAKAASGETAAEAQAPAAKEEK